MSNLSGFAFAAALALVLLLVAVVSVLTLLDLRRLAVEDPTEDEDE